jgi:hypothetical protein
MALWERGGICIINALNAENRKDIVLIDGKFV